MVGMTAERESGDPPAYLARDTAASTQCGHGPDLHLLVIVTPARAW